MADIASYAVLIQLRRCTLGQKEPDWEANAMVQLVEVFGCQVSNDDLDITGTSEFVRAARLFNQVVKRVNVKK